MNTIASTISHFATTTVKRMSLVLCLLMSGISCWASDFVLIGSYKNSREDTEYNVILEYEDDKFIELEIEVKGIRDCKFTKWEIPGKNILNLYGNLTDLQKAYQDAIYLSSNRSAKARQTQYTATWPKFTIAGIRQGETTDYETLDFEENAVLETYFYESNGTCQLIIISDAVDKKDLIVLESCMNFINIKDFESFVKLIDPNYLRERMDLKKKLEAERK